MITEPRILVGRYRLDEFLGQGGMARVYRGTDLVLARTVAVKVLADRLVGDPSFVDRFRREARAAAGLAHPAVVAVFDTGSEDGVHFIVMEFVEGRTLADVLSSGAVEVGRALSIADAIGGALRAAHRRGLVHRDVKPGNVMVGADGSIKVMDFGIARAVDTQTASRTDGILGTAAYLSPEQAHGRPADPRSDVYSLGVVLYHLLVGRPPFEGDTPVALVYQHLNEPPRPPSALNHLVWPALEAVVLRALAKDPAARHQSAEEFLDELARVRDAGPPLRAAGSAPESPFPPIAPAGTPSPTPATAPPATNPIAPPERVPPSPRRPRRSRPALVVLGVALLAASATAFLLGTTNAPRASPPKVSLATAADAGVAASLSDLETILNEGLAAGDITPPAARSLARQVDTAIGLLDSGDPAGAAAAIDGIAGAVDGFLAQGATDSRPFADRLVGALGDVASAMRAVPAPKPTREVQRRGGGEGHGGGGHGGGGGDRGGGDGD